MIYSTLVLSLLALPFATSAPTIPLAPIVKRSPLSSRAVEDSWIIVLKENTVDPSNRQRWLDNVFTEAGIIRSAADDDTLQLQWSDKIFNGFGGTFSADALNVLRAQNQVLEVMPNLKVFSSALVRQTNAPWGLGRLSAGAAGLPKGSDTQSRFPYTFDDSAGAGTDIYIIDTGVKPTHLDFGGRAEMIASFVTGEDPDSDFDGHGTHCAGTAGGSVFGVAKRALIHGVKVLNANGEGSTSSVISGIDFSTKHALDHGRPSVLSMSLGGGVDPALDRASVAAVRQGVTVVVAAGNEGDSADNHSPGRAREVITVGSIGIDDGFSSFSNFGDAVDVFAPGESVLSAGIRNDSATEVFTGTSMACPHIAGLVAVLLSQDPTLSPAQVQARIKELATTNVTGGPRDTTKAVAFNGASTE